MWIIFNIMLITVVEIIKKINFISPWQDEIQHQVIDEDADEVVRQDRVNKT